MSGFWGRVGASKRSLERSLGFKSRAGNIASGHPSNSSYDNLLFGCWLSAGVYRDDIPLKRPGKIKLAREERLRVVGFIIKKIVSGD